MSEKPNLRNGVASVTEEGLFIDGVKLRFEQSPYRWLSLIVKDISVGGIYEWDSKKARNERIISGTAHCEDRVSVIGTENTTRTFSFSLRDAIEFADETETVHVCHIGFIAANWELNSKNEWFVQCYCPSHTIERIIQQIDQQRLDVLTIQIENKMWRPWSPLPALDNKEHFIVPSSSDGSASTIAKARRISWSGRIKKEMDAESIDNIEYINRIDDNVEQENQIRKDALISAEPEKRTDIRRIEWALWSIAALLGILALRV